jgi:hypothetical protein
VQNFGYLEPRRGGQRSRGPGGSAFEQPSALFEFGYRSGRSAELDWVCRASAIAAAMAAAMPREVTLFINIVELTRMASVSRSMMSGPIRPVSMMPLVRPDVIKLDLSLIQGARPP